MKCNYCHRRPTIVVKTKHKAVNFDMYLCNAHSKEEIVYLNSKYKNKEQVLLSTYQKWIRKNNLSNKCNVDFIETNSILVFQTWDLQELISETLWIKIDNEKWQFYIKTLDEKINKFFLLSEVIEIEKKFVIKTFKERYDL